MTVMSVVKLSELEGSTRIDAEYYQPDYLEVKQKINHFECISLGKISSRLKKGIFDIKASVYTTEGIPFIRISNLKSGFIDHSELVFIPKEINEKEKKTEFYRGDFVLSKTAYPASSWLPLKKCNISQDIIGVSLRDEWKQKLITEYIVVFLNTKYGMLQMLQWFQGNIQMHLALPDTKRILIPILSIQKQVKDLFNKVELELEKSISFYIQAETFLLSELSLQNFKPKDKLSYEASLSKASNVHRIDAEYFNPSYEEVINKTKNYKNGYEKLLTFAESIKPKFEPHKFPQKTFSYVELADINASIGVIGSSTNIIGEEAPSRAKRILKKNDVIVSSVEGSLEKVALVDEQFEGSLASTGFFQFRPKNILPEVLLILSKSPIIQNQLKKECAGTILTAVPKEALRKLIIPDLPKQTQQKIAKLVQESHESRRKAEQFLEEAKKKVEDAIEKSK